METTADLRARMAELWDRVHATAPPGEWPEVTRLTTGPEVDRLPPNFTAWAVGPWPADPADAPPAGRHVVVLPTLDPAAPFDVQRRYRARIVADGSGTCPLCSGVAGIVGPDPERARAGFHALPVRVGVRHSTGCPAADFGERERRWFPAFSNGRGGRA